MELNPLTPEEEKVIVHKGTEPPFIGEYDKHFESGVYVCRRCNAPLYRSKDKFDAHCGWPSFDDEIKDAVKKIPDPDGIRTEIICANCGAHLGHVFIGEGHTSKNIRHCVNSVSLKFIPKKESENKTETAFFGSGCFWCAEAVFKMIKGVISVKSGYSGGSKENPQYEEVSGEKTGHAEVVKIEYDPKIISYEDLLDIFFYVHDPTSLNRQGDDIGHQYRSIILFVSERQKQAAEKIIKELEETKEYLKPIITELKQFEKFYEAENYHQNYYEENAGAPYCQLVISPKLERLKEKYKKFLK
ncbi:MAG: bifunctional methionine sulfoxide reductase B/A protein [Patescibacteria group bacterium]